MRILQIGKYYPPHKGGMESHLKVLCEGLQPAADVRVLVASDNRRTTDEVTNGVLVTRLATVATWRGVPVCPSMAQKIRSIDADLVHLHHPNPMAVLAYLVSGHRGRLIITWHSDVVTQ